MCHTGVSDDVVETEVLDPLAKSKIEVTTSVANEDDDDDPFFDLFTSAASDFALAIVSCLFVCFSILTVR